MHKFFYIISVLLFLSLQFVNAQYKINYELAMNGDSLNVLEFLLEHSGERSLYRNIPSSKTRLSVRMNIQNGGQATDSTFFIYPYKDTGEIAEQYRKTARTSTNYILKDFRKGAIYFTNRVNFFPESTAVLDTLNNFGWELVNDTSKQVLGKNCYMARCIWRGRSYTAWYAIDLPLFDGPYKFSGLPGLIMQIYDSENKFNYTCTSIQKDNSIKVPIAPSSFIEYSQYAKEFRSNYKKIMEAASAADGINGECPTCKESDKHTFKISAGIEKNLY